MKDHGILEIEQTKTSMTAVPRKYPHNEVGRVTVTMIVKIVAANLTAAGRR
jgi:hypothetical protein